ncbi:MAG: hypothetical protein JSS96_00820 [Bacteroidetes bacterium]|nr:hypothetical protein [Bacteroidota bacterium]
MSWQSNNLSFTSLLLPAMYRLYLTIILVLFFALGKAQTQYSIDKANHNVPTGYIQIKGKIILEATREPMPGLTVELANTKTTTDRNGKFVLNVPDRLRGSILYLYAHGKFDNGATRDSIFINQEIYGEEQQEIVMYWMPVDNRKEHVDISAYKIPGFDTTKVDVVIIVN